MTAELFLVKAWQPGGPEVTVQAFTDRAEAKRAAARRNRAARKVGAGTRYRVRAITSEE